MSQSIRDLPTGQLKLLVAFAASWMVCGRPPTVRELRATRISPDSSAFAALTTKGLLTCDWNAGRRLSNTMRPTQAAWEQLGINAVKAGVA